MPRMMVGLFSTVREITGILAATAVLLSGLVRGSELAINGPSAQEVVNRMIEMNQSRAAKLPQYTSQRIYVVDNQHFAKRAEVAVQESYLNPERKDLRVVSVSGSPFIQHKVIDKLIDAEIDAARAENRDQTYITSQNYKFRLIGTEDINERPCYVLEVIPKVPKKYLMRGRIWVDVAEFAIVRMEGSPAKNPSFWTRKVHFVRRYERHGPFWLPSSLESESEILIAGTSSLKIEYFEYQIGAEAVSANERRLSPSQESVDGRPRP
jgi:hypothetical protein